MRYGGKERELLFKLLQENASLAQVRDFLQDRGLSSSAGSWDAMINARLKPALQAGHLTPDDLVNVVRVTEEHGAQHVFLYRCSRDKAATLMDPGRVGKALRGLNLEGLLEKPRFLDQPHAPTIADVRWEGDGEHRAFLVKI